MPSVRFRTPMRLVLAPLMALLLLACARVETLRELEEMIDQSSRQSMEVFESRDALARYLSSLERARKARTSSNSASDVDYGEGVTVYDFADDSIDGELMSDGALSSPSGNRSITNTQEAMVDEGGIVKMIGDNLVVLRRGRLFSIDVSSRNARPIDAIDISPRAGHFAWYDELLVAGDTALVLGYSYDNEGSELLRFRLDPRGHWHRIDSWVIRSSDYYSSRNYASRLVDGHIVMYTQAALVLHRGRVSLPAIARWDGTRIRRNAWSEVMEASDIYRPVHPTSDPVLHVVIDCDARAAPLRCQAQGIIGPTSRSFYVSRDAVYVWLHTSGPDDSEPNATVHRLPFDGTPPGALRTWGTPRDQFSFKERDGMLAVLLSFTGPGDGMWGPVAPVGEHMALMRVPVTAFANGVVDVEASAFVDLGRPDHNDRSMVNRFVGEHLLFGEGDPWMGSDTRRPSTLNALRYTDRAPRLQTVVMPHAVERIEALGDNAMVIGGRGKDLFFTSIELGPSLRRAAEYIEPGAGQGETRSHGFFFSPRSSRRGVLGLPVRPGSQPGWAHLAHEAPGVIYLAVDDLQLSLLGALHGNTGQADVDDHCDNSCIDWYGSTRPLFIDDRVFALLGYELVEGRISRGRITERGRTNLLGVVDGVIVPRFTGSTNAG